jgi:pimeloyl-ACP methyl ester carboxylesterase
VRWLRRGLLAMVGLVVLGALGLLILLGALLLAQRRWPERRWRWWTKAGAVLAACLGSALLGLVISDGVHATRLPDAASASTCTFRSGLTAENMANLFNRVSRSYGRSEPIHLAPVGPPSDNTVLVMIPGQVTNHTLAAVKAGLGVAGDRQVDAARAMIEQYRHDHNLPGGTWVIVAGHSYGGIIAQLLANDPGASDFRIAAVITWGAPSISPHANGVAYQQYFSHYDVVPMLSTYELAWPLSLGGVLGALGDLAGMQAFPALKGMHTGQTYVPDMGQYRWPGDWLHTDGTWNDAHDGYGDSTWMQSQTLAYHKGAATCVLLTRD